MKCYKFLKGNLGAANHRVRRGAAADAIGCDDGEVVVGAALQRSHHVGGAQRSLLAQTFSTVTVGAEN